MGSRQDLWHNGRVSTRAGGKRPGEREASASMPHGTWRTKGSGEWRALRYGGVGAVAPLPASLRK